MARRNRAHLSAAAYTLVDLSGLDNETRQTITEDAYAGGGQFGVRVVEESVNGGARAPIFGYYKGGEEEERWQEAKDELGISASEVDDSEAYAASGVEVLDGRRAAALREAAAEQAAAEADAIRSGEARAIGEIAGDDAEAQELETRTSLSQHHRGNIVDDTLARDATNVEGTDGEDVGSIDDGAKTTKKSTNKAPK